MVSNSMGPGTDFEFELSNAMGFQTTAALGQRRLRESRCAVRWKLAGITPDNFGRRGYPKCDMCADYGRVSPETAFPKPLTNQHHVFRTLLWRLPPAGSLRVLG